MPWVVFGSQTQGIQLFLGVFFANHSLNIQDTLPKFAFQFPRTLCSPCANDHISLPYRFPCVLIVIRPYGIVCEFKFLRIFTAICKQVAGLQSSKAPVLCESYASVSCKMPCFPCLLILSAGIQHKEETCPRVISDQLADQLISVISSIRRNFQAAIIIHGTWLDTSRTTCNSSTSVYLLRFLLQSSHALLLGRRRKTCTRTLGYE